ncbi:MAG: hypothetical protein OXU29_05500 [Gammaproteobacteria bacterium]|nr:hypothetical protein [Gammaproteobacteria bacterium]MDD9799899.1 hypothetical protein [Gammaproteobacteria bacterium]
MLAKILFTAVVVVAVLLLLRMKNIRGAQEDEKQNLPGAMLAVWVCAAVIVALAGLFYALYHG